VNPPRQRAGMRRAIVILPSAFTSGSLFFGVFAIVQATRGEFAHAAWFIVVCGVLDGLDGIAARITRTGTNFGAELDSLVDAISFGVAPALLVFFHTFRKGEWAWMLSFVFILAVVLRLARFNVEQAGRAKSQFFGLPSPAAGLALALYFPFSQTAFFRQNLASLFGTPLALAILIVGCSLLMVSHVPYPVWPKPGLRTAKGLAALAFSVTMAGVALTYPDLLLFPFLVGYILLGITRATLLGILELRPDREPLSDEDEDEPNRQIEGDVAPRLLPFKARRRRRTGGLS
jgi:CDP-diacylglycerol--serine O-phosphatidyltransferase